MSSKALLLIPAVLGLGAAAYFALGPASGPVRYDPEPEQRLDEPSVLEQDIEVANLEQGPLRRQSAEEQPGERQESEDAVEGMAWAEKTAELLVRGRVVDKGGQGIPGAAVGLWMRPQFPGPEAFGGRGPGGGPGGQGRGNEDWRRVRDLFRMKKADTGVQTDAQGRYELKLAAYPASSFEIGVQHARFAPNTLAHEWAEKDGVVELENIELQGGGRAFGIVVDQSGAPIVEAEVEYQRLDREGEGGPGGGPGRGRGRGGMPAWAGGSTVMRELLPEAKTNAMGQYELTQLPPGSFRVEVTAKRYFEGRSEALQLLEGASLQVPELRLELGATLKGIVRDEAGQPIADARVAAQLSMRTLFERMREARENGQQGQGQGRGQGLDPMRLVMDRNGMRFGGGREVDTRTDKKGEFVLEGLAKGPLQLQVRKDGYLFFEEEPIDPDQRPHVEVTLGRTLEIAGKVIDARSGEPITNFGLRARRVWNRGDLPGGPGGPFGQRGQRGQRGEQDPAREAERAAREQQRASERTARENQMKARFGGSGEIPRRTPEPTAHEGGQFAAKDLQPGSYVIDLWAPGYVPIAAGPFEVEKGNAPSDVTIRLEAGRPITGVVTSSKDKAPLAGARVRLSLPAEDRQGGDDPFERMRDRFRRGGPGGDAGARVDEARTDAAGRFELRPQRPGPFVLQIEAEGHDPYADENFRVTANGAAEQRIVMASAATLRGVVRGRVPGTRYVVAARHAEGRTYNANVDSESGEYVFESLPSGAYFVELRKQGDRSSWVRTVLQGTQENQQPDVNLPAGAERRFDLNAQADEFATLAGQLLVNGEPGANYEISLRKVQEAAAPQNGEERAGRFLEQRLLGRLLRDRTNAEGRFEIGSIPAGEYELTVERASGPQGAQGRMGRGGRGGGTSLYQAVLNLGVGARLERNIAIRVGALKIATTRPGTEEPIRRARADLVLASEGRGVDPAQWRDLPSLQRIGLRDGRLEADPFPTGSWLLRIEGRDGTKGWRSQVIELQVAGGTVETQVPLEEYELPQAQPGGTGQGQQGPPSGGGR